MKGLFTIAITIFLLVILYACRTTVFNFYVTYHVTPGKAISLFFVLDAIIVALTLASLSATARVVYWLLNRNQEAVESEFDPAEEYIEA